MNNTRTTRSFDLEEPSARKGEQGGNNQEFIIKSKVGNSWEKLKVNIGKKIKYCVGLKSGKQLSIDHQFKSK